MEVLRKLTGSVTDVQLPSAINTATIWGPETYAYHSKWLMESPEKYQAATRTQMIRSNEIRPDVYAQARRQVDLVRREIKKTFLNVDLLITPTMKTPPGTIMAALNAPQAAALTPAAPGAAPRNSPAGGFNTVGAFDVYGLPAITLPCGFNSSGLPIGLQISAAPFVESSMLALAHAYEQATQWHTRRPALKLS
jgi:aspartyl-tRNA(Asn)/glutamyl-tRNA(Gln) amidotransferase subunit A